MKLAFCNVVRQLFRSFDAFPKKFAAMKMTKDSIGYSSNVFAGKKDQMVQVSKYVAEKGFVPKELVDNEVSWFYG